MIIPVENEVRLVHCANIPTIVKELYVVQFKQPICYETRHLFVMTKVGEGNLMARFYVIGVGIRVYYNR